MRCNQIYSKVTIVIGTIIFINPISTNIRTLDMAETEQQSKEKFIELMRNLIPHISENQTNQLTIYECLNTQQIKRLFQSLHDHSKILRSTALLFICKLLYNSPQIIDTLLLRDNCDLTIKKNTSLGTTSIPIQKYIITGLQNYNLQPQVLAEVVQLINIRLKYRKNTLFWYVDIGNRSIGYCSIDDNVDGMDIDPKLNIIGIFVGEPDANRESIKSMNVTSNSQSTTLIRKNLPDQGKGKYTISKAGQGQFSVNRKN